MTKYITTIFFLFLTLIKLNAQTVNDKYTYKPDTFIQIAKQNYKVAVINKDTSKIIKLNIKLFELYKSIDIVDSAKKYLYSAITLSEKSKDFNSLIKSYISLAELLRATYHSDVADKYIYSAIEISFHNKIYSNIPYAYNRLGAIFFEKFFNKNLPKDSSYIYKAIQYVDTSMIWLKKLNTNIDEISNYNILGACYSVLGKYEKSNVFFGKAMSLSKMYNDQSSLPYIS